MARKSKLTRVDESAILYSIERNALNRFNVMAKIVVAECPNQIMAEVVCAAIEDLCIPLVKGVKLPDPPGMPELKPFKLKGRTKTYDPVRKLRSDKGVKRGPKKKKSRRRGS